MADDTFEALGIDPEILRAVNEVGYEEPTQVQRQTIPILFEGRDLLAQSQTGTGKTAAFAIPLIQQVDVDDRSVQGLVLVPTRELAVQVAETVHKLGRYRQISDLPIYGGQPYDRQLRALARGVQIVVGTPGRVMDHMRRGTLDLSAIRMLILDEADQMLDMGFIEDIEFVLDHVPEERQIALFSATLPPRIRALAKQYMHDPATVSISQERITVPEVVQQYVEVSRQGKLDALTRILDMELPESAIVFVRTKRETDELGEALIGRGYGAEVIHGDLSQGQRDRAITAFRDGRSDLLVATDVASRGLDIPDVSHVINYDIPVDPEAYVHRIGRTARAGKTGTAITLVTPRERGLLKTIERLTRIRLKRVPIPTATDIAERRAQVLRETLRHAIENDNLEPYLLMVEELADEYDLAQVAGAAIKLMLDEEAGQPAAEAEERPEPGRERLFIRTGRRHGVSAKDLVGAIANEANIPGRDIGPIDIYDNFSFVGVPRSAAGRVIDALSRATIRGRQVQVSIAVPEQGVSREL
jgi:ATP-dependent RNA helicase DeaD